MKLDKGHLKYSFQDLQKTVRSKPSSVQACQELGVRDQKMLFAQRTFGAVIAARPMIRDTFRDFIAGLVATQPFVARPDELAETASVSRLL